MNKKYSIILIISIVVIVLVYSLAGGGGKTELDIGEDSLSVKYGDFSASVDYKDIAAIELLELADFGTSIDGGSDSHFRWGLWENEVWGEYTQYTLVNSSAVVALHLGDGGVFLLAYESDETTVMLAQLLYDMLTEHGYKVDHISG